MNKLSKRNKKLIIVIFKFIYFSSVFKISAQVGIKNLRTLIIIFSLQSLGNHEFDEPMDDIASFINNVTTPVLAANLILDNVPELQNVSNLAKHIILTKNNMRIGIIGYLTPATKYLAPHNDVEYEDEVKAVQREVIFLKSKGVDILIALGHSGFLKDIEIAKNVRDIDLVIGGHSNTFLWNGNTNNEKPEQSEGPYPTVIMQESGRKVPVIQAYAFTKYLGKLHVIFDTNGEIISYDGNPILLDKSVKEDLNVLEIINKYKTSIDLINNEVVGDSYVYLDGMCRTKECNVGNLINDAVLEHIKESNATSTSSFISVIQGGRIRASIDHTEIPFQITKGDLYTILPYSDKLTIVSMNGSILIKALEHSVESWRTIDSPGQFLQVGGMNVTYDLARPPGSRLVKAIARCSTCLDEPTKIGKNNEYKVIMPLFSAEGGDGFDMFTGLPNSILQHNEREYLINYIIKHTPVNPKVSGRITIVNADSIKSFSSSTSTANVVKVNRFLPCILFYISLSVLS